MSNFYFSLVREADFVEGTYEYKVVDIQLVRNVLTSYGLKDKITFVFDLIVDNQSKTLTQCFFNSKHSESRCMKFMTMICKAYGIRKFDSQTLIETTGQLTIKHNTDENGNIYESVESIVPYNKLDEKSL